MVATQAGACCAVCTPNKSSWLILISHNIACDLSLCILVSSKQLPLRLCYLYFSINYPQSPVIPKKKKVKSRKITIAMGLPSFEASNAIIYLTYGAFLCDFLNIPHLFWPPCIRSLIGELIDPLAFMSPGIGGINPKQNSWQPIGHKRVGCHYLLVSLDH